MNVAKDQVAALVDLEYKYAKETHGSYHSLHEGYAVMLEEVEECQKELRDIEGLVADLWDATKEDKVPTAKLDVETIESAAVRLASEAIQVAAVARKIKETSISILKGEITP